jgi:general secretion pathway protein A
MYVAHFGLREAPFSLTPDPRFVFLSERHREALAHLLYGVSQGGSFVQLTGEVGTGKTTVCRCLLEQLPPEVDLALILNPKLTAEELLASICDELRVAYPAGTTSVKTLMDALNRYLLDAAARGRRTVLIIDEAQNLSADVLEQVRLLTNLETTREKLLQVILIGQPELIAMLARPELRQLAQRVTARYHLVPFSRGETAQYVLHRLKVAGRHEPIFTDAALYRLHRVTRGIPRLINVVCDRALLGAYVEERHRIDHRLVARAAAEVFGRPETAEYRTALAVSAAVLIGVVGIAVLSGQLPVHPSLKKLDALAQQTTRTPATSQPPAMPQPVATAAPPVPAPVTAPRPGLSLAAALADAATVKDRESAFKVLYARWGRTYATALHGAACERAPAEGLRCLFGTGTWSKLRRYDLPAVLELTAPNGDHAYATVTALGEQTATLAFGGQEATYSFSEIDAFWSGRFILLWPPPAFAERSLRVGIRHPAVAWVRQRLDAIEGTAESAPNPDVFDAQLEDRVIAFQRARALDPDGVVGEETLVHLTTAVKAANQPRLAGGVKTAGS